MLRPVLVLAVLVLAGCSGPEPAVPEADLGAVRADLAALFAGDHPGARESEAGACFAEELTDRAGLDRLRDGGVLDASFHVVATLPPLDEETAGLWADAQFACTDFVEESIRAQVKVTRGGIDTEAYAACLAEALTEEEMRAAVVDSLTGDWTGVGLGRLGRAQTDCSRAATPPDPS